MDVLTILASLLAVVIMIFVVNFFLALTLWAKEVRDKNRPDGEFDWEDTE